MKGCTHLCNQGVAVFFYLFKIPDNELFVFSLDLCLLEDLIIDGTSLTFTLLFLSSHFKNLQFHKGV